MLRQATYGTLKLGFYQYLKKAISSDKSKVEGNLFFLRDIFETCYFGKEEQQTLFKNIACGCLAGASANALANPTDVLKIRMQSSSQNNLVLAGHTLPASRRRSMAVAFAEIYSTEGFRGLYRVRRVFVLILDKIKQIKFQLPSCIGLLRKSLIITLLTA